MSTEGMAMVLLGADEATDPVGGDERAYRRLVERGVPSDSVGHLVASLPATQRKAWRNLLAAEGGARLPPDQSERAARLAYVLALAIEVWGGKATAYRFMAKPHPFLDGKAPLEAARTEWGGRAVESILRKIQFGLPA